MMTDHDSLRDEIIARLSRDLFGPYDGPDEVIGDIPLQRYSTGILYPRDSGFDANEDDGGLETESQDSDARWGAGGVDAVLSLSNCLNPSSYGLSFCCLGSVKSLEVTVRAGIYDPIRQGGVGAGPIPVDAVPPGDGSVSDVGGSDADQSGGQNRRERPKWQRRSLEKHMRVDLKVGDQEIPDVFPGMSLHMRVRETDLAGAVPVTLSVVNDLTIGKDDKWDMAVSRSFFQTYIGVRAPEHASPFVERTSVSDSTPVTQVGDEAAVRLLYRHAKSFAAGHGCSVTWNPLDNDATDLVETTFVPASQVYSVSPQPDLDLPPFRIKALSEASADEIWVSLSPLVDSYDGWITMQRGALGSLPDQFRRQAQAHLERCEESKERIKRGISLLRTDCEVRRAFQLAHRAMLYQLGHAAWRKQGSPADKLPSYGYEHQWFPFQIGFILQCLESTAIPGSPERDIVDLLWFPTGGGKTEAYMGLIAFVLFLRRIRYGDASHGGGGITAIMRYTLRLLTTDQFQRASMLISSCEKVRREEQDLVETAPISIGLWVGGDASPNRLSEAKAALNKIKKGTRLNRESDPMKLRSCPWCGRSLSAADYSVSSVMEITCPNRSCEFHSGLPVWIIDDDVYEKRPSLLIGTVDKFARIPWVEEAGQLFGGEDVLPPELIVQDELHLISGPLGTMVGLYEIALDMFCRDDKGHRAKVISSTATIKNATSQTESLFWKGLRQFPSPGLDSRDSFFAKEDRSTAARTYVGVFCPGKSIKTAMVRTYGMLLHAALNATGVEDSVRDPYVTLIGYFNSLRELGGTIRLVEDDIDTYLKFCADRDGDKMAYRKLNNVQEMTSRIKSVEVDNIREQLWKEFPSDECLDVLLATNMISVGLDVPRLGMMVVAGQPKGTGEYIQCTSRVGRKWPGLVAIVYNWARSRDRSHYERFDAYHSRLYGEVEATSVTPFSSRARERGLHAVLISLVRHRVKGMDSNDAAVKFRREMADGIVREILQRVSEVDPSELDGTEKSLNEIIDRWEEMCKSSTELWYFSRKGRSLLEPYEKADDTTAAFATLNSLRNVDPPVGLHLEGTK